MKAKIQQLLKQLRSDDRNEVFDAGTGFFRVGKVPIKPLLSIVEKFPNAHNREYAVYALITVLLGLEATQFKRNYLRKYSFRAFEVAAKNRRDIKRIIETLIETINFDESPKVRAQALETLGMSSTARKSNHKLRRKSEKSVISALSNKHAEVRFWACYAAGQLKMKNALPKLSELAANDTEDWGQWWRVSEEAEDAIDWIHGRDTEPRIPIARNPEIEK